MKTCEMCGIEHYGSYATGRFCSRYCSRRFSTFAKRNEINKKVSLKLSGRKTENHEEVHIKRMVGLSKSCEKQHQQAKEHRRQGYLNKNWDDLTVSEKKYRVIYEQQGKCLECNLSEWRGKSLILEYEHINGTHSDNRRENVRALCPNCHSQTPTWRGRNNTGKRKVDDDILLAAIKEHETVSKAFKALGLAGGKNYARAWKLLESDR